MKKNELRAVLLDFGGVIAEEGFHEHLDAIQRNPVDLPVRRTRAGKKPEPPRRPCSGDHEIEARFALEHDEDHSTLTRE